MIHVRAVFHQNIQKRDQAQTCCHDKKCRHAIKGAEHPHQNLLFFNIPFCDRGIQCISDCRSNAKLG